MYALPYLILVRLHQAAIDARRRSRAWRFVLWQVAAGLVAGIMIGLGVLFVTVLFEVGLWYLGLVMVGVMIAPVLAQTLTRRVLVPLGLDTAAYHVGKIGAGPDAAALGLVHAAAACRDLGSHVAVQQRLDARRPLGDGEVVAAALLAARRGDEATARQLMRSTLQLIEVHPAVREIAGEWLAADAAERGAWRELAHDAAAASFPATPLTFLLEGIAARHVGAPDAPSLLALRVRWALAPRRRITWPLLAEVSARRPDARRPAASPTASTGDDEQRGLPRAIGTHLALRNGPPDAMQFGVAVRAWDVALGDPATRDWLARRALELDAPPGAADRALREVASAIVDELGRVADAAQLGDPGSRGPVGDGLAQRLRHGRLDALEQAFTRWAERRTTGEVRSGIDEWRELVALRAAYDAAVGAGGLELRRLAFPHAFSTGSNMAAWLWNSRQEYVISHAISKWLLAEARLVGDTEAIELGHRNTRLDVPTHLGSIRDDD